MIIWKFVSLEIDTLSLLTHSMQVMSCWDRLKKLLLLLLLLLLLGKLHSAAVNAAIQELNA